MKKFKFLVKYGLKKRIGRKAFVIANIVIAILTIGIINLPSIINYFGDEDDQIENINIDIFNDTTEINLADDLSESFNAPFEGYTFYVIDTIETIDIEAFWLDSEKDVLIEFTGDISSPSVKIYSKYPEMNAGFMNLIELQIINYQIGNYERPTFETVLAPDYEDPEQGAMLGSIASLLTLPMFILITMATQFVGVDIIEEKSTKAIETIIASVPAKIHFLSKITSSIIFVIVQGGLAILYGTIGALISKGLAQSPAINLPTGQTSLLSFVAEVFPNWPLILTFTLLFMVIGTLFYLTVAALFASMAVTQEDYQQFQSPLMLMLLGGFYIGIFAPMAGGDGFLKVMAFIPIFTPIVAPIALAGGMLSTLEAVIALLFVGIILILSLYLVAPVYRVAILSYEQTKFFKRIKDNFKKAFQK
ncbi:MAG: hypothetical protein CVV61_01330 [Tenericutes bacterium HGW-Tenericutes-6]|jgi:ABC-2 type transport system permease protein|nr:MAG: hypothetical protein CVV61_01330 [Tenericutes bacterium HGW-Tenericutes-6]